MLIWNGHGILIPILGIIGLVSGTILGAMIGGEKVGAGLGMMMGGIFGAGLVWLYALTIGKTVEQVLQDPKTGRPVRLRRSHSFFFIPAFAWAILASIGATGMIVIGTVTMVSGGSDTPVVQAPGAAELNAAERLISTKSNGSIHGNTEEAEELARRFASASSEMRDALIEKGKTSTISLSGGDFLTYCQMSEHGTAFIVHVPGLRKFSDEAKTLMCDAAWFAASQVVADLEPAPQNLAVGVRGVVLYESILVGVPGKDFEDSATDGLLSRHRSSESDVLHPFFASPPRVATGEDPTGTATAESIVVPEAGSGSGETAAADQTAAAAPTPANDAPKDPTAETATPGPKTDVSTPLSGLRDWTSADGRSMRASLIRFTGETGEQAEFKREDGAVFTIAIDQFSPETQAELKLLFEKSGTPSQ